MIELINVSRVFNSDSTSVVAVDNISIKLPNTGFVALYGENGCGKTTLLNLISTIDEEYCGEIKYNSENYRDIISSLRSEVISYVFQENKFVSNFSVADNIEVFTDDLILIDKELKKFDILDKKLTNPQNLSGGQKQRASLIRGLVKKCTVLLVDEPTSAMNEEMENSVFKRLKDLSENKLVVLVSHNLALIKQYADLVLFMDKGQIIDIQEQGTEKINYGESALEVPENFYDLSLIDREYVRSELSAKKQLLIKVKASDNSKQVLDYTEQNNNFSKERPNVSNGIRKKMQMRFLKTKRFEKIFFCLILAVLISTVTVLDAVSEFDKNQFAYFTLSKNKEEYVPFVQDNIYDFSSGKELFTFNAGENISKQFNTDLIYFSWLGYGLPFEYSPMSFYADEINALALYSNEIAFELDTGSYPQCGEALVTDFLADSLIYLAKGGDYSNYEDIIQKGINAGGFHIDVSGIIKTDYKKYISSYGTDGIERKKYENEYEHYLCMAFYSLDNYLTQGGIPFCFDSKDYLYFSVKSDNGSLQRTFQIDEEIEERIQQGPAASWPRVYVNEALYEQLEQDLMSLYIGAEPYIIEGVIDDNENSPIVYCKNEDLDAAKIIFLDDISGVLTKVESKELIDSFEQYCLKHESYYSEMINRISEIADYALEALQMLNKIIPVVMAIFTFVLILRLIREDNLIVAFFRMQGKKERDIWVLEIQKIALCTLLSIALSGIISFATKWLVNGYFSKKENAIVPLVRLTLFSFSYGILALLMAVTLSTVCLLSAKMKQNINKLL